MNCPRPLLVLALPVEAVAQHVEQRLPRRGTAGWRAAGDVDAPRLWWPWALGEQSLTDVRVEVVVDGKGSRSSILKDFQQDALKGFLTHFDLQEVRLDQPITAQVVVELVGEARAASH